MRGVTQRALQLAHELLAPRVVNPRGYQQIETTRRHLQEHRLQVVDALLNPSILRNHSITIQCSNEAHWEWIVCHSYRWDTMGRTAWLHTHAAQTGFIYNDRSRMTDEEIAWLLQEHRYHDSTWARNLRQLSFVELMGVMTPFHRALREVAAFSDRSRVSIEESSEKDGKNFPN